jgi:hypothetical protein
MVLFQADDWLKNIEKAEAAPKKPMDPEDLAAILMGTFLSSITDRTRRRRAMADYPKLQQSPPPTGPTGENQQQWAEWSLMEVELPCQEPTEEEEE